jgi:pentatricopeptide repeat protein
MSLGSCIAKRGRAVVNASLVATPREPLLFLYPQWGRYSPSAAPRASNDSNKTALPTQVHAKPPTALDTRHGSRPRQAETNVSAVRIQTRSSSASAKAKNGSGEEEVKGFTRHGSKASEKEANPSTIRIQTLSPASASAEANNDLRQAGVEGSTVDKCSSPTVNLEDSTSQSSGADTLQYQPLPILSQPTPPSKAPGAETILGKMKFSLKASEAHEPATVLEDVEKRVRRIMYAAKRTHKSEQTARSIREEFQEYRRESTDNWTPDWRKILESLVANTPHELEWHEQQIQIAVPSRTRQHLLTGLDTFIWDIGDKYGCSIALGYGQNIKQIPGVFVLSGSKSAISRTLADVLLIAPDAKIMTYKAPQRALPQPQISKFALPEPQQFRSRGNARTVVASDSSKIAYEQPNDVPKPSTWTQQLLLDYIRDLTATPEGQTAKYPQATVDAISSLFRDPEPELRAAITRTACHEALRYLVAANRMVDVRVLFVRMELFQLPLTPETFNIMLRGVAKQRDIHNFHFILHLMIKRGFLANGHTWIAYMMAMDDFQMKVHVAIAMKVQGLLMHKSILKGVCEQLVQPEVELSLDAGQDQESFVAHMAARYGHNWLTLDSGNLVLDVLGSRGLISRCWDFLHFMDSRFIRPDQYSINTILNHCKQTHNLAGAVELMHNISPAWGWKPNQETFRIIFDLAWSTRNVNVAKVAWKYSCMAGLIERSVRMRVKNSMRAAWNDATTPRRRWTSTAGSIIFGTYCGLHPMRFIGHHAGTTSLLSYKKMGLLLNDETVLHGSDTIPRLNGVGPFPPSPKPEYKLNVFKRLPFKYVNRPLLESYFRFLNREFRYDCYMPKYMVGLAPRFPFEKMLGDAWARDIKWKDNGTYRNERLRWLVARAIRIPVKAKWLENVPDVWL